MHSCIAELGGVATVQQVATARAALTALLEAPARPASTPNCICFVSPAAGFWPVTVAVPIACFIRAHQPPARTQAWLHALNTATLLVTLAACVGAVYAVTQGWSTYGFFKGGG